jgi:HK97 family phage prohead protease
MEYTRIAYKLGLKKAKDSGTLQKFLAETPYLSPGLIEKSVDGESEQESASRDVPFVMTDSGADREGDIVISAGVDTTNFSEAGSVLWGHRADHPDFVLGYPVETTKEETRIKTIARFFPAKENEVADRVYRMVKSGGLRGMSVGLLVAEYSEASDRPGFMPMNILRSELIETSVTPVPMNPRAISEAARGSADEAKAITYMLEEATETQEQVEASSEVTGLTADEIKALVLETIKQFNGNRTIDSGSANKAAPSVLDYYLR